MKNRAILAAGVLAIVGIAMASTLPWVQSGPGEGSSSHRADQAVPSTGVIRPDRLIGISSDLPEDRPPYPEDWISSLDQVESLEFGPVLPDAEMANPGNATAYYVPPDGSMVSVTYPLASQPVDDVRQDYLEVWQSPWSLDQDPETRLGTVLKDSKIEGAFMDEMRGVPMVVVPAHSPTAIEGTNPALVWFVVGGTEFQVSGGDSMEDVLTIVDEIVARARSVKGE